MSAVKTKRRYHSPLRRAQAEATRLRILEATRDLFREQGFAASSISAIARSAGVVPETIYATFGSKRALLDGLIDAAQPTETVARLTEDWTQAGTPRAQLTMLAATARTFWERNEPLAWILRQGTGDADFDGQWAERSAGRRALLRALMGQWDISVVRPGMTLDEAADVAWSLASEEVYHMLVVDRGWTADRYQAWLADALVREVLPD
jgi:AcrR family transcriptional regulator